MRTRPPITIISVLALVLSSLFGVVSAGDSAAQGDETISDETISIAGVGPTLVGSTIEELIDQLGDEYEVGDEVRITVDFDGHVVSRDGQVQFRAVFADDPAPELTLFIVNNRDLTTAEGVGPGTTIAAAEAIYGDATLRWDPDEADREFVEFENQPRGGLRFRTPGIGGNNVGVYPDGELTTDEYEPGARIAAVWISCVLGVDCPAPTPAPTPEPTPGGDTGADGGGGDGGPSSLPETGAEHVVLVTGAALFFLVGGSFVLFQHHYLAPRWLRARRR